MPKRKSKHADTFIDFIMNHDPRMYNNQWNHWDTNLFEKPKLEQVKINFEFHIDGHECWAEIPELEVVTLIPNKYRSKECVVNILVNICKNDFHQKFREGDQQPILFVMKNKTKFVLEYEAFKEMLSHPLIFNDNEVCLEDEEQEDSTDEASEQGSGPGTCEEAGRLVQAP